MSSSFTPSNSIDMSNEKTWPASLGMLDWDSTNIVFTKRSLIEFLKNVSHRTTVDPNFTTIAKLPRYAKFGTISNTISDVPSAPAAQATNISVDSTSGAGDGFRPSRRVRTTPGGAHTNIFGHEDDDDALANAPPRQDSTEIPSETVDDTNSAAAPESLTQTNTSEFRPTRRVRANPGGTSTIGSLFGTDDGQDEFKPTRRVREGPGGQDHIGGLF